MDKQKDVLKKLGEAVNLFNQIPDSEKHPSDQLDFIFHIHALQNLLYAQLYIKENGQV